MAIVYLFILLMFVSCEDLYVHPNGTGSCKETSKCTVEEALVKLQKEGCQSTKIYFDEGEYTVTGVSVSLSCSSFSILGARESSTVVSLTDQYEPLISFEKDVKVNISEISFHKVGRTIMSASYNKLDLALTSSNFTAGTFPLVNNSFRVSSVQLRNVHVENWQNGFILIRRNEIACNIAVENTVFKSLQNTCPIMIENNIHLPESVITATINDVSIDSSRSIFHPSSGISLIGNTIDVTLRKFSMTNGEFGGILIKTKFDLTFKILEESSIRNMRGLSDGGAIYLHSKWGSVHADLEDSTFEGNIANFEGGVLSIDSNRSIVYNSKNNVFKDNHCHSGDQHRGGGAVSIRQTDLYQPGKSKILITGDQYLSCYTDISYGGVFWISLNTYEITISDSYFYKNEGGFPMLGQGQMPGGVIYLGSMDSISLTIRNSEFKNNTGQEGGVVFMANFNTTNEIWIEDSNFTNNRAFDEDCFWICQTGRGGVFFFQLMQLDHVEHPSVKLVVRNNIFVGNSAVWDGGLFYLFEDEKSSYYDVEMIGNEFLGNSAWGSGGIGFMYQANGVLRSNRFVGNVVGAKGRYKAGGGGLAWIGGNSLVLESDNVFEKNSASRYGGALYVSGINTLTIHDGNTLENNYAKGGGGLYLKNVGNTSLNSAIQHNRAEYGGGMVISFTETDVLSVSQPISKNYAKYGGGVYVLSGSPKNLSDLVTFVHDNTHGNILSNPESLFTIESSFENKCSIGGKNNEWWNCNIFNLRFLGLFGKVLDSDTLESFSLRFVVPSVGKIDIFTQQTLGLSFSFLPQTPALSTSNIHGKFVFQVWFSGVHSADIEVFFDNGVIPPPPKSYLWVLYMCLIIFFCLVCVGCLCCLTWLVCLRLMCKFKKGYGQYEVIINENGVENILG